jgi:flagellar motor switch protein FliM
LRYDSGQTFLLRHQIKLRYPFSVQQEHMATRQNANARTARVLDPRTLGRPVHLLGRFAEQVQGDLADFFHAGINRRYRARFRVSGVSIESAVEVPPAKRWHAYSSPSGRMNFYIERKLLLCVLAYRYGSQNDAPTDATILMGAEGEPETATEERLADVLGSLVINTVARRIDSLTGAAHEELKATAQTSARSNWTMRVEIAEDLKGTEGRIWLRLDDAWMDRLLRGLAPVRDKSRGQPAGVVSLPNRLQFATTGRLLEKEMPLGALLDLAVGDVIPVSLGNVDVLVGDSRLFTASLTEHKGRLCLTSFSQVE